MFFLFSRTYILGSAMITNNCVYYLLLERHSMKRKTVRIYFLSILSVFSVPGKHVKFNNLL